MNEAQKQPLAITTMPIQQWSTTYDDGKALHVGTLFPDLDLPFYMAADPYPGPLKPSSEKAALLHHINAISFVIYDLVLYLDTHEDCQNGLKLYKEKSAIRDRLLKDFANAYYPLTSDCVSDQSSGNHYYNWCAGPLPWEGACS